MISLYRAFAEDSRERLLELGSIAFSTPYAFVQNLKKERTNLKQAVEGCTEDHFYV